MQTSYWLKQRHWEQLNQCQFEQALGGRPQQYASAPCKLTISSYFFARWWCCSGITISSYLFTRWHLFWHVGYVRHQKQADLWPFDLETVVRVTCDMGYLCANFSFRRPLCSRVGPNVHDRRQTDRRQTKASLIASTVWGGGIIIMSEFTRCAKL